MASDYNSKLISDLYNPDKKHESADIADIMGEIGDPVFLHPLYDAYKRYQGSTFSHYFPSNISDFSAPEALGFLTKIFHDDAAKQGDKLFSLPGLARHKYFEKDVVDEVAKILTEIAKDGADDVDADYIIDYLRSGNLLSNYEEQVRACFENPKSVRRARKNSFRAWLHINPVESFDYLISNYERLKADLDLEATIAQEISTWTGTNVERLKEIIRTTGGSHAKEIILKSDAKRREKKTEESNSKAKDEEEKFGNSKVVYEILEAKDRINIATLAIPEIAIAIFPADSRLPLQSKSATDSGNFSKFCLDLRSSIGNIASETENHGLSTDEIEAILPSSKEHDVNKPINRLNLFLHSKAVQIDKDFFGLRKLYRLLSMVAHPDGVSDAVKILKELNLLDLYQNGDWQKLHNTLLNLYLASLKTLESKIRELQPKAQP